MYLEFQSTLYNIVKFKLLSQFSCLVVVASSSVYYRSFEIIFSLVLHACVHKYESACALVLNFAVASFYPAYNA